MAANHEHDHHPTTATQLGPLTDAVELLADHGYDVTTATIAADPSPDAPATITLELAVPEDAADREVSVSDPSADESDAPANRGQDSASLGTTAPLARCEEGPPDRTEDATAGEADEESAGESLDEPSDAAADETTEEAREAGSEEYWCRKCGYGPGTKRAIAIHNGHKHGGDAVYASTEPAQEGTESSVPRRSPEEIDAIVEEVVNAPRSSDTGSGDAAGELDEPDDTDEPVDADESPGSSDPTADRSHGERPDATPVSPDGDDAGETDSSPADAPPTEASAADDPESPVAELPDLGFPIPDRVTADAVREAVDEAEDLEDVQASLKWPAGQCRILLEEMGLGGELIDASPEAGARRRSKRTA